MKLMFLIESDQNDFMKYSENTIFFLLIFQALRNSTFRTAVYCGRIFARFVK